MTRTTLIDFDCILDSVWKSDRYWWRYIKLCKKILHWRGLQIESRNICCKYIYIFYYRTKKHIFINTSLTHQHLLRFLLAVSSYFGFSWSQIYSSRIYYYIFLD